MWLLHILSCIFFINQISTTAYKESYMHAALSTCLLSALGISLPSCLNELMANVSAFLAVLHFREAPLTCIVLTTFSCVGCSYHCISRCFERRVQKRTLNLWPISETAPCVAGGSGSQQRAKKRNLVQYKTKIFVMCRKTICFLSRNKMCRWMPIH